jgi:putrescine transport system permease protein
MVLPIYSIMEKIGNDYFEASLNLGARAWQTFWNVTVPLTKRGIISGCFLVFSSSISELIIPELFGGEGAVTMGRVLWQEFFHNIDWPTACTIAIVTMLIVVPLFHIAEKK